MRKKEKPLLAVCAIIFVFSGVMFLRIMAKDRSDMAYWESISGMKEKEGDWDGQDVMPQFQALYDRNPDIVGWISIEGTRIDYPVMQTREDPEYYLRRNFDKEYDDKGTPFADYRCDILPYQGFNTIIYGHNTSGDDMFRWLLNYSYKKWYLEHREIRFDTLRQEGIYEVAAVFYVDATDIILMKEWDADRENAYTFYNYIYVDSEEGFRRFADGIEALQMYETEVRPTLRSHLITLVCCAPKEFSGIEENGRFIVIAVEKRD